MRMVANTSPECVVIIGAGIAGIASAKRLQELGFRVIVLESSSRIGGRIYTDKHTFGIPIDLGASWIHGASPDQNPVAALAQELKLVTYETSGFGSPLYDHEVQTRGFELYGPGARRIPRDTVRRFEWWFRKIMQSIDTSDSTSVADAMQRIVSKHGIASGLYDHLLQFFVCRIEGWFASEASRISTHSWILEEFYNGGHLLLPDGYSSIVEFLAQGLDIRLRHRVLEIQHMPLPGTRNVRIVCENGCQIDADAAVVAVPLGILKSNVIHFDPPLPSWKKEAISGLEVGQQNKIALLFDSVFWPEDAEFLGCTGSTPRQCSYFLSMYRAVGRPLLVYMPVGDLAREIELWTDENVVSFTMSRLRQMIPDAPYPVSYVVTRWSSDVDFLGCYSNDPTSEGSDLHQRMALPVSDWLHFAGEASSVDFPSTVHGAYQSGIAAAEEIAEVFMQRTEEQKSPKNNLNMVPSVPIFSCNLAAHLLSMEKAKTLKQVLH